MALKDPLLVVPGPQHLGIVQPLISAAHVAQNVRVARTKVARRLDLGVGAPSIRPHVVGRHIGQRPRHPRHLGASVCTRLRHACRTQVIPATARQVRLDRRKARAGLTKITGRQLTEGTLGRPVVPLRIRRVAGLVCARRLRPF